MICSIAARSIAARSISSHHCLLSLVYWCSLHHSSLAPSLLHRLVAMTALAMPPRARLPQALPPRALSSSLVYCCSSTVARYILTPSSVALSIAMLPRDASLGHCLARTAARAFVARATARSSMSPGQCSCSYISLVVMS